MSTTPSGGELPPLGEFEYAILRNLPDEGRMAGYHPLVATAPHVTSRLNAKLAPEDPKVTGGQVGTALYLLGQRGLTVRLLTLGGSTRGYQRTAEGARVLAEHEREVAREQRAARDTYKVDPDAYRHETQVETPTQEAPSGDPGTSHDTH